MKHPNDPKDGFDSNIVKDSLTLVLYLQFFIHALAWPFRLMWIRPGYIGRRVYGFATLAGLMFGFPLFGQWPNSREDMRLFMRAWSGLWLLLVTQAVASWLWNRRNRVHSMDIGSRPWVRGFFAPFLIAVLAHTVIRPVYFGIGAYLTWGPLLYVASQSLVNAKMNRGVDDVFDAEIAGRDFQHRLEN